MSMTRQVIQGLSIILESPVTLAATGIWIPFGSLLSVILVATGIQSPFPRPTWCVSAGMFHLGRQPVHPASHRWELTVLVHNQGSGFPVEGGNDGGLSKVPSGQRLLPGSAMERQCTAPLAKNWTAQSPAYAWPLEESR